MKLGVQKLAFVILNSTIRFCTQKRVGNVGLLII
jgi:hypothetical protein